MEEGEETVEGTVNTRRWRHYRNLENFFLPLSQDLEPIPSSFELYNLGYINADIIGNRNYSCSINEREIVNLVREPSEKDDCKAIKVLNMRMAQVGYIDQHVAAFLSPYMDSNSIKVGGIVTTESKASDFKISCQIYIFSKLSLFLSLNSDIEEKKLKLFSDDNLFSSRLEAMEALEEKIKCSKKNLEPPKEVIKSELLLHQKEGLLWLHHREKSGELPPFWEENNGIYVHMMTNYKTDTRPEPLQGGILADDMGSGKTLTLLSLIALDKYPSVSDTETAKKVLVSGVKRKLEDNNLDKEVNSCGKTTLIVCPPSVISTWTTQLKDHTIPDSLKLYKYYGNRTKMTKSAEELKKHDIVLTTYGTLVTERYRKESPVKEVNWWRIILDEGHMIRKVYGLQTRAVCDLKANRRWVVTGTPIQYDSTELHSWMLFLQFTPFSDQDFWSTYIHAPIYRQNVTQRLQVLMAAISLRRTKDEISLSILPPKTIETCYVKLSKEEQQVYNRMKKVAKVVEEGYRVDRSPMCNYTTLLNAIVRLRQVCTDLAVCPSDLNSLPPSFKIKDASNNPELLQKAVDLLEPGNGEDYECPICLHVPDDTGITRCGHLFCRKCILKILLQSGDSNCPLCRGPLTTCELYWVPPAPGSSDVDKGESSSRRTTLSSKTSALLQLLKESRDKNSATKSVVFSQFSKMLMLLEKPLKEAGFKVLRLDGSTEAKRRPKVIAEFGVSQTDGATVVLLASLNASGTGINLNTASRVYLFEPWWNPAVEEQAIGLVHRIGQKEEVKIVRLIAQNTIEEAILALQEDKNKLGKGAFGERNLNSGKLGIRDLQKLILHS